MRRLKKFAVLFLITTPIIALFFYFFFNLGKFFEIVNYVNTLPQPNKSQALGQLKNYQASIRTGIYSNKIVSKDGLKGVFLLNLNGLKYYKVDSNTKLSSLSFCKDDKWKMTATRISKSANINYDDWLKGLKVGDYVQVIFTDSSLGTISELISYDWWPFANPIPINYFHKRCSK